MHLLVLMYYIALICFSVHSVWLTEKESLDSSNTDKYI